ncbi:hypothetical protein [Quadrisphaera sp. KR29]|uniref:hypothetical protein n=1 Tax=Quadrisphaera sp. KR29 TaxID=3461391 RepID=UPI00404515EC
MDTRSAAPRRSPLLPTGLLLLGLSFVVTLADGGLSGGLDGGYASPAVAWIREAAFWAGMICVAGHVLRLVLAPAAASPSEPPSWGETQRWGPPSQR